MEFSFFNPSQKKYFTLKSQQFTIDIKPGDKLTSTEIVGKEDIKELGTDIRFLKTSFEDVKKKEEYIINSTGFIVAGAFPFVLSLIVIGWKRKYDKLHGNVVLLRYQKAQKIAKTRLKTAKKLMDSQNHKEFYTELSSALFGYLEDKLHIPKSEFTIERASDELRKRNLTEELITDLKTGAEKCEFVRFAPGAEKSTAMQDFEDRLIFAINDSTVVTLVYDGDGNRVRKTVNGTTTYYLVDHPNPTGYVQVLEEQAAEGGNQRSFTPAASTWFRRTGAARSPISDTTAREASGI